MLLQPFKSRAAAAAQWPATPPQPSVFAPQLRRLILSLVSPTARARPTARHVFDAAGRVDTAAVAALTPGGASSEGELEERVGSLCSCWQRVDAAARGTHVAPSDLRLLRRSQPRFSQLSLAGSASVTDEWLEALAAGHAATLQRLDLTGCTALSRSLPTAPPPSAPPPTAPLPAAPPLRRRPPAAAHPAAFYATLSSFAAAHGHSFSPAASAAPPRTGQRGLSRRCVRSRRCACCGCPPCCGRSAALPSASPRCRTSARSTRRAAATSTARARRCTTSAASCATSCEASDIYDRVKPSLVHGVFRMMRVARGVRVVCFRELHGLFFAQMR